MAAPIFAAEFMGNGTWAVIKVCPVNPEWSRFWYYYEDTSELIIEEK